MIALTAGAICDAVEAVTGVTTAGNALGYVNAGYDRVLSGLDPRDGARHIWSFLAPVTELSLTHTTTGTATGVYDGTTYTVITATTAIFAPTQVGDDIVIATVGTYEVATYTSATKVSVAGSHAFVGQVVTLPAAGAYDLPTDFAGLLAGPVYAYDTANEERHDIVEAAVDKILEVWRDEPDTSYPQYYAIVTKTFASDTGQRWQILVAPRPDATRLLRYQYLVQPSALSDSTAVYPLGGGQLAYTIQAAAFSEYERLRAMPGQYTAAFDKMLAAAIDADRLVIRSQGAVMLGDD